jgi:hypothetical protein
LSSEGFIDHLTLKIDSGNSTGTRFGIGVQEAPSTFDFLG